MPVEVHLAVIEGSPYALLRAYPPLARLARSQLRLDVTALALHEDIYGHSYPTPVPVPTGQRRVALMPVDLADHDGRSLADLCGRLRTEFFDFVADVARRTHATIYVTYSHERGDWLYELVQWVFGPRERLDATGFDGTDEPQWTRGIGRGGERD